MIPAIGFMIAAYIITRMLSLLIDKSKDTSGLTKVFAAITILVSLYAVSVLVKSGTEIASKLSF